MWNMAVNNISYLIYPLSTRTEKGYITKMIPFFFCSVYQCSIINTSEDVGEVKVFVTNGQRDRQTNEF